MEIFKIKYQEKDFDTHSEDYINDFADDFKMSVALRFHGKINWILALAPLLCDEVLVISDKLLTVTSV